MQNVLLHGLQLTATFTYLQNSNIPQEDAFEVNPKSLTLLGFIFMNKISKVVKRYNQYTLEEKQQDNR